MRIVLLCLILVGCGGNIGGKWIVIDCGEITEVNCVEWPRAS